MSAICFLDGIACTVYTQKDTSYDHKNFFYTNTIKEIVAQVLVSAVDCSTSSLCTDWIEEVGDDCCTGTQGFFTILPSLISLLVRRGFIDGQDPKIGSRTSKYLHAA
jgi:hypothetical protein